MAWRELFLFLIFLSFFGCGVPLPMSWVGTSSHPYRQMQNWKNYIQEQKKIEGVPIYHPSDELIDFLGLLAEIDGLAEGPETVRLRHGEEEIYQQAFKTLPKPLLDKVAPKLIGIFLVSNLGSSGLALSVMGKDGPEKGLIFLDVGILRKSLKEWIEWRNNSAISRHLPKSIQAMVSNQDKVLDQVDTIRYILMHEMAHVLAINEDFHPATNMLFLREGLDQYSFSKFSWRGKDLPAKYSNRYSGQLGFLNWLKFYSWPRYDDMTVKEVKSMFKRLSSTNFPSLYATTSVYEDFAESLVHYFHTQYDKRPYALQVGQNEVYWSCFLSGTCQEKLDFFNNYFKN